MITVCRDWKTTVAFLEEYSPINPTLLIRFKQIDKKTNTVSTTFYGASEKSLDDISQIIQAWFAASQTNKDSTKFTTVCQDKETSIMFAEEDYSEEFKENRISIKSVEKANDKVITLVRGANTTCLISLSSMIDEWKNLKHNKVVIKSEETNTIRNIDMELK